MFHNNTRPKCPICSKPIYHDPTPYGAQPLDDLNTCYDCTQEAIADLMKKKGVSPPSKEKDKTLEVGSYDYYKKVILEMFVAITEVDIQQADNCGGLIVFIKVDSDDGIPTESLRHAIKEQLNNNYRSIAQIILEVKPLYPSLRQEIVNA